MGSPANTTFYEMKGGGTGIVHEGRYQLKEFDDMMARFSGQPRQHTVRELFSAVNECFRKGADFDIAVDDGRPIKGYRRVVKLSEKE